MVKEREKVQKSFPEFLYTWRVENVNLCWQKTGESLQSPTFEVEWLQKSSFMLCLYPKCISGDGKYISCYLAREDKAAVPKGLRVDLYILTADGSIVNPENSEGFLSMRKSGMLGYSNFLSWKTFWDKKSKYFPDSILTFCCRMWNDGEVDMKGKTQSTAVKAFGRTKIRKDAISKLMVIENIVAKEQKIGEIKLLMQDLPIATFSAYFDKISGPKSLTIDIDAKQNDKILMSTFKLILIDAKRKRIFWKKTYPCSNTSNLESIVLASHFSQNTDQYHMNVPREMFAENFLLLNCQFTFTTGCVMKKRENDDYDINLNHLLTKPLHSRKTRQCQTIDDALMNMYLDTASHDISIKTRTSSITAHELVLCNRSVELKSLVESTTGSLRVINVDDDIDIMKQVVYFLYTDTIQDINWEIATSLYSAAAKYKIDLLKYKCRNFIKTNLEKSNVVEILLLAKKYNDAELNALARDFIKNNKTAVFNSEKWSHFMKSEPNLAVQMLLSMYELK